MQNKPNLGNSKMNITLDITSIYEILSAGSGQKTKPKQTQFNPIQSQFKAKQTQFQNGFPYIPQVRQATLRPWQLLLSTRFGILV